LAPYWDRCGYFTEGRAWLGHFLAECAGSDADDAAIARRRCTALCSAGSLAYRQGDATAAMTLLEEGLALARRLDDSGLIADCINNLGVIAKEQGDYVRATALFRDAMARDSERGDQRGVIIALANLGWVAHARGDYAGAAALADECLRRARELGDRVHVAYALGHRAHAAIALGEIDHAAALYRETLTAARDLGVRWGIPICLEGLARVAMRQEQPEKAARWWGAAEALREEIGTPLPPDDRAVYSYDRSVADARARLGDALFETEWAAGQAMGLEQAIAEALGGGEMA
jgi:tetratricopeptide (TPR) repeat protein